MKEWIFSVVAVAVAVAGLRWMAHELLGRGGYGWGGMPYYSRGSSKGFDWRENVRRLRIRRGEDPE
jgi:hypothetical protein